MAQRTRNGRLQLDLAGVRVRTGAAASTVNHWHRHRAITGFPPVAATDPNGRRWWWLDDIDSFHAQHLAERAAAFTTVDRNGDPNELLTAPQAAKVLRYRDHRSLPTYLRAEPDHVEELPSGRLRRRWYRRTIWSYADSRAHRHSPGPPPGTRSTQRKPHPYAGDARLDLVRELLHADTSGTGRGAAAALSERLGVSTRTAQRLLQAAHQHSAESSTRWSTTGKRS